MTKPIKIKRPVRTASKHQTIEEYAAAISALDLLGVQLSKGDFNGKTVTISRADFSLSLRTAQAKNLHTGIIADGYIAMLFPLAHQGYIFDGRECRADVQAVSHKKTEHTLVAPDACRHFTLLLNKSHLAQYYGEQEAQQFVDACGQIAKNRISPVKKRVLTNDIYDLFNIINQPEAEEHSPLLWQDHIDKLFYMINEYYFYHLEKEPGNVTNKEKLLSRALEYIHAQDICKLTVSDLVNGIHASSRSLQYCFSDLLGLSPKNYIIKLRMNAIRKELLEAEPGSTTLTELANKYGILNVGRFKQEYEAHFNETPRATLQRTTGKPVSEINRD